MVVDLYAAGMSMEAAAAKARLFERAADSLGAPRDGCVAVFVPGRIEVLGKHTDYAGGRSLLAAAERGICLVARPRTDPSVRVTDIVSDERVQIQSDSSVPDREAPAAPGWGVYVSTVVKRLRRNFPSMDAGADIAFGSDLPIAAGMSSSSALVTSIALAMSAVNGLQATAEYRREIQSNEDLAEYLGTVENGQSFGSFAGDAGVGTFGGSEDHTAMLCCRAGEMSLYRFCPVHHELQVPMPPGYVFVVAVSGVSAEKTGAARENYNEAARNARRILEMWNAASERHDASLRAAIESGADAADRIRDLLGGEPSLLARFEQFYEETFLIIPRVSEYLKEGRVGDISDLVDRSQRAAERGLANQVPETAFLARSARELGAPASSAFGAGFGGSVWALTEQASAAEFAGRWAERYRAEFSASGERSEFFVSRPGPGAIVARI